MLLPDDSVVADEDEPPIPDVLKMTIHVCELAFHDIMQSLLWLPSSLECQSQEFLQQFLFNNDFVGLIAIAKGDKGVMDKTLLVRLEDLEDGGNYYAKPRYGGLTKLRTTVSDLSRHNDNLSRRREGEMEQALMESAPQLLGMPSWLCTVSSVSGGHKTSRRTHFLTLCSYR